MPFHWGGDESVNRVTNDATDPVSGMPEFKVCAVTVPGRRARRRTRPCVARTTFDQLVRARPKPHGGPGMRLVVIGNGMVGSRFVEDLLTRDRAGKYDVTVIGAEGCEPYNRVLLSEVVAGRYDLTSLTLPTPDHPRLRVLRGTAAAAIDRDGPYRDDDRRQPPPLRPARARHRRRRRASHHSPGSTRQRPSPSGVHALRSIDDAREIIAATLNSRRAVVLGAGVLGIEAASGLAQRGCAVTIVHPADALMERQLDGSASRVLAGAMPELGIHPRIGVGAEAAIVANGRLTGIRLTDGDVVESDLLLVATGTIANSAIARTQGSMRARHRRRRRVGDGRRADLRHRGLRPATERSHGTGGPGLGPGARTRRAADRHHGHAGAARTRRAVTSCGSRHMGSTS